MTGLTDVPEPEGGARVRAFLDRLPSSASSDSTFAHNDVRATSSTSVRAYLMTGGRTESGGALAFEAMLSVTPKGRKEQAKLAFERGRIVALCPSETQSVAELAAKLNIPIPVVQVLAADMVSAGTLDQHVGREDLADDVDMLQRLIHGIRTL